MLEAVPDLPGWLHVFKPVVRGALTGMRPRVVFGGPVQPVYTRNKHQTSWWHVPIMIKAALITRREIIERVTVRLVGVDRPLSPYRGISLRWYSRDHPNGISVQDLEVGRIYLIPVVIRDETDDGRAFITNEDWMLGSNKEKWPLDEGRHDFWIDLWSGKLGWRSDYLYRIIVPQRGTSNGPFTMEVFYGGVY